MASDGLFHSVLYGVNGLLRRPEYFIMRISYYSKPDALPCLLGELEKYEINRNFQTRKLLPAEYDNLGVDEVAEILSTNIESIIGKEFYIFPDVYEKFAKAPERHPEIDADPVRPKGSIKIYVGHHFTSIISTGISLNFRWKSLLTSLFNTFRHLDRDGILSLEQLDLSIGGKEIISLPVDQDFLARIPENVKFRSWVDIESIPVAFPGGSSVLADIRTQHRFIAGRDKSQGLLNKIGGLWRHTMEKQMSTPLSECVNNVRFNPIFTVFRTNMQQPELLER